MNELTIDYTAISSISGCSIAKKQNKVVQWCVLYTTHFYFIISNTTGYQLIMRFKDDFYIRNHYWTIPLKLIRITQSNVIKTLFYQNVYWACMSKHILGLLLFVKVAIKSVSLPLCISSLEKKGHLILILTSWMRKYKLQSESYAYLQMN